MTLIAAFHAPRGNTAGPHGIALCADSQETVTYLDESGNPYDLRKAVQKIAPIYRGLVQVAIAGSGNGGLIEAYITRAERALSDDGSITTLLQVRDLLEAELGRFYKEDVSHCPDEEKSLKLFVAVSCPHSSEYDLWVSEYSVLKTPNYPALIGWAHEVYFQTAARLSNNDLTLSQAVLASIYTLTVAKQTSNYVGGDLSVAIVSGSGIWMENAEYVNEMESRLRSYEAQVNQIFLSCADTSVPLHALRRGIEQFSNVASALHREQIDRHVQSLTLEEVVITNDPYPKFPLGSSIIFNLQGGGPPVMEHDENRDLDVFARQAWEKFTPLGYVEHFLKTLSGGKYELSVSGRWTGTPNQLVREMTKADLLAYCSERDMLPMPPNEYIPLLDSVGTEAFLYLRVRPAVLKR